jgi:hypothetical protein
MIAFRFHFPIKKGVSTMQEKVQYTAIAGWNQQRYLWLKTLGYLTLFVMLYAFTLQCLAGAPGTGGTGASGTAQARVTAVAVSFLNIMIAIGVAILSAAFLYVGYGMAFGGKRWADVGNVAYGCLIAGMGSMMVGWLFS